VKLLVLTSEAISSQQLRDAVDDGVDPREIEVMVVAPALQDDALHFWLSDADDAIAQAEEVSRKTVEELDQAGVPATGDTGESDPGVAIQDALATFPAERIVVFTRGGGEERYREDIDASELEQRFGVPVDHARV
jgi:nucleotide-binding universal stress UspA family protein